MRVEDYIGGVPEKKTAIWLEAIRSAIPLRPHLVLNPDRAALLIIDMLHYFAHPNGACYLDAVETVIPRLQTLLAKWRTMRRPVVYTRHCHEGPQDLGMLGRFFTDYIRKDSIESHIIDALAPADGEPVIIKTSYDSFLNTALLTTLKDAKVTQVVITGVLTHMCCETTARAAFCRGFEVYLPVNAMASSRESLHFHSLMAMADCVGMPISVEEVLARCV